MPLDFLMYGSTGFVGDAIARLSMQKNLRPLLSHAIGRIIEGWNLVAGSKDRIVYGEFKKQYDGIVD